MAIYGLCNLRKRRPNPLLLRMAMLAVLAATTGVLVCNGSATAQGPIKLSITIGETKAQQEEAQAEAPFSGQRAAVDVAILLDTSNSMDGLISQAKSQLWTIVQQFAEAQKDGKSTALRVAVFEYGNSKLPASEGYIRQVCQLTDDLDKVSECLFALQTSGGDEYCGMVIGEALKRLDWNNEPNSYKSIFIAGNEPFTQGEVDFRDSCKQAIERGIVVNTIHCGDRQSGIQGMWQEGAQLAEGEFLNIDQDRQEIQIECPQDKLIIELNTRLNSTYLWYGKDRMRFESNQAQQDANAQGLGTERLVQRVQVKGGAAYSNRGRDLVDSFQADKEIFSKLEEEELPEEIREMSPEELKAHLEKLTKERSQIQSELAKLAQERSEYRQLELKKRADETGEKTLGDAMVETVRKQLKKSGFEFSGENEK